MIRYRLPHNYYLGRDICMDCGASEEAIEDGRKSRYCRKNRKFKCPGYLSEASLEEALIKIAERCAETGIPIAFRVAPLLVVDDPGVGFHGWGFKKIMDEAFGAAARDGVALYSTAHPQRVIEGKDIFSFVDNSPPQEMPILPPHLRDPASWYLPDEEKPVVRYIPPVVFTAAEHCKLFCAWKGGDPCRADDCPRRTHHENGDGV